MAQESFARLRDWVEPAHPSIIERFEDLVAIYTNIRDHFQKQIDQSFDDISRQIGFVVTTTVPVVFNVAEKGQFKGVQVGSDNLKGTLFDKMLISALNPQPLPPLKLESIKPGAYNIYVFWHTALKLKLRTDWMEPAHYWMEPAHYRPGGIAQEAGQQATLTQQALARVRWDVREPAHWFDPGIAISPEDAVLIEAIDHVYTDLHLAERVATYRSALRYAVRPEVQEPAHFRQVEQVLQSDKAGQFAAELAALLKRYGVQ